MNTYIQIGANIGKDDFQKLVEKINEKIRIILVEPNLFLLTELSNNYEYLKNKHEIIIYPYGISLKNEVTNFYVYNAPVLSSLINRKSHPSNIPSIKIETKTFNELCEHFSLSEIEYLEIDTEGLDYEILNSIDLSVVDINTIVFEKWPYVNDDLNGKYRTGENFLNNVIKPKFKNFLWKTVTHFDNIENYKLIKITENK